MPHLNHEVDLNRIKHAPRLAKMPRESRATHRQGVIENDELVALATPGGDVPALKRNAVVRWKIDVAPAGHAVIVGSPMEYASERLADVGHRLDLLVVLFGNAHELFLRLFHSLL
jgi:hypothetical protein